MKLYIHGLCKKCYMDKFGNFPIQKESKHHRITDEAGICDKCKKKDILIIFTNPTPPDDLDLDLDF